MFCLVFLRENPLPSITADQAKDADGTETATSLSLTVSAGSAPFPTLAATKQQHRKDGNSHPQQIIAEMLEAAHRDLHDLRLLVEAQAAIGLVPIPKAHGLPYAAFIRSLLGGHDLAANPWQLPWQMEGDACIHSGNEKLVGPKLRDDRRAVRIFCSGRPAAIRLRKTE